MNRRNFLRSLAGTALATQTAGRGCATAAWKAGVATVDITPRESLWMAGFARRMQPSQGVALPLHAKALALQCRERPVAVLVTVDLLGVTARSTSYVAAEVERRHGIPRANLLFNASHTHCGPVVDEQLSVAYDLSPEQWTAIRGYSKRLDEQLVAVVGHAIAQLRPARLSYARGEAGFAANRRVKFSADGPVDRSVPVLRIDGTSGESVAVAFGYACHNTTLQDTFVQYHGDYAGVAQDALERRHPTMTALFVAGCGADANPSPRGTLDHVRAHGEALAAAVERVLPTTVPIAAALQTSYGIVDLPFVGETARTQWRRQLPIDEIYLRRYDALMEALRAREGRLPAAQPQPIQIWRFGTPSEPLTLVALGGEVVVDYALRLGRDYADARIWAAGYSNDVFGYVPSLRVLKEGGYEGADAMVYYGRPGPFTDTIEERIFGEIARLMPLSG
jgi:hypothetical protein